MCIHTCVQPDFWKIWDVYLNLNEIKAKTFKSDEHNILFTTEQR